MQIQVNTDSNVDGNQAFLDQVETTVSDALSRFNTHITRIEVHLSDKNGDKSGQKDKRCMIEVRLKGRQPTAVTCEAPTVDQAIDGASGQMKSSLQTTLGRIFDRSRERS